MAQIVHAFSARGWQGFALHLLGGVLYLLVGGWMILKPLLGALALTLLLAAFLLVQGIFQIALALRIRPARGWGWPLASGVVTLLLAVLIYAGWPSSALWVIGLLVGIHLLDERRGADHAGARRSRHRARAAGALSGRPGLRAVRRGRGRPDRDRGRTPSSMGRRSPRASRPSRSDGAAKTVPASGTGPDRSADLARHVRAP